MFFRPTPGPTCVEGPTGSGKSYVVVEMILPLMRLGIPTFSNFPIIDHKSGYKSKQFDPSRRTLLMDCIVVLDEAWGLGLATMDYRKVDPTDEEFFRFSRQNGVILIVISQSGSVKVVRDCCDTFVRCTCLHLPARHKVHPDGSLELVTGYPLMFTRTFRKKYDSSVVFLTQKSFFSPYVGSCYDHRSFRNKSSINYDDFEYWDTSRLNRYVSIRTRMIKKTWLYLYALGSVYTFDYGKEWKNTDRFWRCYVYFVWIIFTTMIIFDLVVFLG